MHGPLVWIGTAFAIALAMHVVWRVFGPKHGSFPSATESGGDYVEFDATQVTPDD